ncbi:hypothetical protein PYCCODRAFT_256218 [Trametes coccinea BRFM310]|uniref:Homeobox domain-containing protein n=1 Tax=Trametes coccinea (strain BRFM310) TaxID=1353009 RepID=A0A1Y2IRM2_TRAC3|nr:hypothetical protein PYCCODRAFT_256218 [Trametes coccinea BRFM310]
MTDTNTSLSPRKTRSSSRLASGTYDVDPSSVYPSTTPPMPPGHLGVGSVAVMKASSMEPVRGLGGATAGKRARHKMTDVQLQRLEELYQADTHPSRGAKEALAREVGMTLKSVLIWFQNRRQDRRRKSSGTAASKAMLRRAEQSSAQRTARKTSVGQEKSSPTRPKAAPPSKQKTVALARPASRVIDGPNYNGEAAPKSVQSARTHTSGSTEDSMDVDRRSSPSTAPTSVRQGAKHPFVRVARSPSSSLDSDSSDAAGSPKALWRLIVSSPPPPPPLPPAAVTRSEARDRLPFSNVQASGHRQGKPDLEWACANSAARRKHGYYVYRDEDDSEGESSELEGRPRPLVKRRWKQRDSSAADRPQTFDVPHEYEHLFPPDMVLGASLLLTLKHSTAPTRL